VTDQHAVEFWEHRYAEQDQIWSGEPNRALVTTVTGLRPGRALDLGCGEGSDSIWLAAHGWRVTAVDIASTAIARARALAARRRIRDGCITWIVRDLSSWDPPDRYELVSACFLHSPLDFPRASVLRRAAAAVGPGGHLLIVGHAGAPPLAQPRDHAGHHFLSPAEEHAMLELDHASWDVVVEEVRPRRATGPDGQTADLDDSVLLVRRRSSDE